MRKRFTVRSLLAITTLVALFFAFPFRKARIQQQGRDWVAQQRGHVSFEYDINYDTGRYPIPNVPNVLVDCLGVDMFNPVRGVMLDCETIKDLGPLRKLESLQVLAINIDMAKDLDFSPLKSLPELEELYFTQWSMLNRQQLKHLRELLPDVKIHSESHPEG